MNKRTVGVLLLLVCMSLTEVSMGETPDLTGVWVGPALGNHEERGIIVRANDSVMMNVINQTDRIFFGELKLKRKDGNYRSENFTGMIETGGEEFVIIDHEEGFCLGDILGPDEVELIYLKNNEGDKPALIGSSHMYRNAENK